MAGILDSKKRFIDLVITQEGKRQIADGLLRAEYASFSDAQTYYEKSDTSQDVSNRIYFQPMERPENVIVLEKDDSGRLIDFNHDPNVTFVHDNKGGIQFFQNQNNGQILSEVLAVTGSSFASQFSGILSSSIRHFKRNHMIGTFESDGDNRSTFELDQKNISFSISNSIPFPTGPNDNEMDVDAAEPFLLDPKLTHLNALKFLPPVNEDGTNLGSYTDYRNMKYETWDDIKSSLGINSNIDEIDNLQNEDESDHPVIIDNGVRVDSSGDFFVPNRDYLVPYEGFLKKEFKVINFKKTSIYNNIFFQIYESNPTSGEEGGNLRANADKFVKLDLVDAGVFYEEDDRQGRIEKRVVFAGKVFFDNNNTATFVNIFTIILD